jgi:hypothetical protein
MFSGCGGKPDNNNNEGSTDPEKNNNEGSTDTTPTSTPVEVSLEEVFVYMENSKSMKGYNMSNSNGFINVVSQLTHIHPKNTKCYFYSDKLSSAYNGENFSGMVSGQKVVYGESSPLKAICSTIINKMNKQSLSFLVTDAIMSGSNADIKANRDYNKRFAAELQMGITSVIDTIKDIGICIYQFKSNFNGTYYCFNNAQVKLKDVLRPFYVIAIGERNLLKDFHTKVIENKWEYFKPENYLALGLDALPYKIAFSGRPTVEGTDKDGYQKYHPAGLTKDSKGKKIYVSFKGTLNMLPAYMQTQAYFDSNRLLFLDGKQIEPGVESTELTYDPNTYKVKFQMIANRITRQRIINIKIKNTLPDWYTDDSDDDDLDIEDIEEESSKTFNLEYFIKGFYNGIYKDKNAEYIINEEIKLTNNNKLN